MNTEHEQKLKTDLEKKLGRPAEIHEQENMKNDALLLAHFLIDRVVEIETRLSTLEKRIK